MTIQMQLLIAISNDLLAIGLKDDTISVFSSSFQ